MNIYRYIVSFLIVLSFVSALWPAYGFGIKALLPVIISVAATVILDLIINYFKTKAWIFPQSALISGLFIGGLLTQNLKWYIYVLAGVIAILSKHLIKFKQKHVFNPANFGILLASIIFGAEHTWWISSPLALVIIFGIFLIWRMRRFDLALSFILAYFIFSVSADLSLLGNFNELYLFIANSGVIFFFSMYMLIEPKTTPPARKQRIVYGIFVALLLIFFNKIIPIHDLPLALAIGNLFVPLIEKKSLL